MRVPIVIKAGLMAAFIKTGHVHAFSREYYEKKGFKFGKDSAGIGGLTEPSAIEEAKVVEHKKEEHEKATKECQP